MKLSKLISNSSICDIERKGRKKDNSKNVNINNDKDNDKDKDNLIDKLLNNKDKLQKKEVKKGRRNKCTYKGYKIKS